MKRLVLMLVPLLAVSLAGCADDAPAEVDTALPAQISQQQVDRLELLVSEEFPRAFAFPGQAVLDPFTKILNDTLAAGEGFGLEPVDDDGLADFGGTIKTYDISDVTPAGQPVELRLKLKWGGDPGASADLDLYVDVPGVHTSYSEGRLEESLNWNIVTKTMVVNTVRIEGEPFMVGIQAQNGKMVHPDGMPYSIEVEAWFPEVAVLPPQVPVALTMPEGGTGFILESEPVTGDEHVSTELVIAGPDGGLHRAVVHNDIGTETLFIPASEPGDYVFYVAHEHGGFLRVETDVPNPTYQARILQRVVTEVSLGSDVVMSPAQPDPEGPSASYGAEGAVELTVTPLDLWAYIRASQPGSLNGDVQIDILSDNGVVATAFARASSATDEGRLGDPVETSQDLTLLGGTYSYGLRGDVGLGTDVGYGYVTWG